MKNFIINSYTNSFEIKENGHGKEYQKGVLSLDIDPNNDQVLEIRTTQARQQLYKIDLSVDTVNVNGSTVFATADELRDEIRPFFYRSTGGGGGDQPLIPSQNAVDNFSLLPPAGDHTNEIWFVRNQTGTWIGSLIGSTRKQSGLYKSNGSTWEPTNDPLQYWVEGQISFKDNDGTGELLFNLDLSGSRTVSWQDRDLTVAGLDDIPPAKDYRHIFFALTNATPTTIAAANTPVKIAGQTTLNFGTTAFDMPVTNRIRNNSGTTKTVRVTLVCSSEKEEGGGTDDYTFYIAQNGAVLTSSKMTTRVENLQPSVVVSECITQIPDQGYVEGWVENNETGNDVLVVDLSLTVEEL